MSDLVKRLRNLQCSEEVTDAAADRIEALEAALRQAREAHQKAMKAWSGTCAWHADIKSSIAAINDLLKD